LDFSKMSQENSGKGQRPIEKDNDNNIHVLTAELVKVKEEKKAMEEKNKVLEEKLGEAEQNAKIAKNEVWNIDICYYNVITARMRRVIGQFRNYRPKVGNLQGICEK
jgi:hypothetical protein